MRQHQKEQTHQKLFDAAIEIFARDGFADANIADVTTLAGVSRASFYFHFPTKDDVLTELLGDCEEEVLADVNALHADAPLREVLDVFTTSTVRAWSNPLRAKLIIDVFAVRVRRGSVLDDRESEIVRSAMARRFARAAQRQELSALIPAANLSDLYLLHCFAVMASWGTDTSRPLGPLFRSMTELFMNGAYAKDRAPFEFEARPGASR